MKFNLRVTFDTIYRHPLLLQLILFWNYVPFLTYLLVLLQQTLFRTPLLMVVTAIVVLIVNILYQLYLWAFSFFMAQDSSQGYIAIPELSLSDLFYDFGVKLRLLGLRIFWYLPLVLIVIALASLLDLSVITSVVAGSSDLWRLAVPASGIGVLVLVYYLIAENWLLVASQFYYSYTNSLIRSLSPLAVIRFCLVNFKELAVLTALNTLFYLGFGLVFLASTLLLSLPIIGAIFLSILTGFFTSWHTLLLPALHGQIWAGSEKLAPNYRG